MSDFVHVADVMIRCGVLAVLTLNILAMGIVVVGWIAKSIKGFEE